MKDASHPDPPPSGEPTGDLDPEIAAFARRLRASEDPAAALLRPLPDDAAARLAERVLRARDEAAGGAANEGAKEPTREPASVAAPEPAQGGRVIPLPRRRPWTRWLPLAAAAALALAVVPIWRLRPQPERIAYVLQVKGDSALRGDDPASSEPVRLRPSTPLRVALTPEKPARDRSLRVLVVRGDKVQMVTPAYSVVASGAIAIDAAARDALGDQANGPAELVFVVGAGLPADDEVERLAASPGREAPPGATVLRRAVLFEGWGTTRRDIGPRAVELAGCTAVTAGPVCEVAGDTTLRFWLPVANDAVAAQIDGRAAEARRESVQEGTRLALAIPPGSKEITLVGAAGEVLFRLPLRPSADVPALREAFQEMRKNHLAEAESKLTLAESGSLPEALLQALRIRARLERRRKNPVRARELLEQAISRDHATGRVSDELDDRYLLAYQHLTVDYDFAAAEDQLSRTATLESQSSEGRIDGDYHRGLLAVETGRLDAALAWLRRSSAGAERLMLPEQDAAARQALTEVLGILGRRAEARALLDRSLQEAAAATDPCARTRLITSAAWARLRGVEGADDTAAASRVAAEAVTLAKAQCPDALAMSLLNLAFTEAGAAKPADARAHLGEARLAAAPGDRRFQAWSDSLAVTLDLTEQPEKALAALEALRAKGEASLSPELSFEAALGRARALDALGHTDDARTAFAAVATALDHWSELVPLGEGRETFFSQQDEGARYWVDFLVRQAEAAPPGSPERAERVRAAADAARASLVRFFTTLARSELVPAAEQGAYRKSREAANQALAAGKPVPESEANALRKAREDTRRSLSAGALLAPSLSMGAQAPARAEAGVPGRDSTPALTLLYHPVQGGWVGFALEANGGTAMERLPSLPAEALARPGPAAPAKELSAALLQPFATQIERAAGIRVPAHGALRHVPFEALPWKGRVLADSAPVTYGFDGAALPAPPAAAPDCSGSPLALLVTNPRGDLPGAETAGPRVQQALLARGWEVRWLAGPTATRPALLAALKDPCAALFHYDGHARFEGRDGLHASLVLHDDRLTVTDILALPRVPAAVTLLGCATAEADGLGLAQAFLVRGSRQVLASTADVDDTLSLRLAQRLYDGAGPASEGPPVLSAALRTATAAVRAEEPGAGPWWLFRVLSR